MTEVPPPDHGRRDPSFSEDVGGHVQDGAVANVTGDPLVAAMSPPTALSLTWGLQDYVDLLSAAAQNAS